MVAEWGSFRLISSLTLLGCFVPTPLTAFMASYDNYVMIDYLTSFLPQTLSPEHLERWNWFFIPVLWICPRKQYQVLSTPVSKKYLLSERNAWQLVFKKNAINQGLTVYQPKDNNGNSNKQYLLNFNYHYLILRHFSFEHPPPPKKNHL